MGGAQGDEDTLVRPSAAAGQTDPYAPPWPRDGWIALTPGPEPIPTTRARSASPDPYAQALPKGGPRAGRADAARGDQEIRTPPGGLFIHEPPVFEAEALPHPRRTSSLSQPGGGAERGLRRAGSEAPADLWSTPSTEAVGSKQAERTPLRLGPQGGEEADLWKLVEGAPADAPSFEAALRQVDGRLESLAGLGTPLDSEDPRTMPIDSGQLDALVARLVRVRHLDPRARATVPAEGSGPDSGRIALAGLSGTRCLAATSAARPPELSAERRRELLQQARAQVETDPAASLPTRRRARSRTPSWPRRSRRATPPSAATRTGSSSSASARLPPATT